MTFASDIFEKLNNLNAVFHEKGMFANKVSKHVRFFQTKVWLFAMQAPVRSTFDTFPF